MTDSTSVDVESNDFSENKELVEELIALGLNDKTEETEQKNSTLSGKKFVVTGKFDKLSKMTEGNNRLNNM